MQAGKAGQQQENQASTADQLALMQYEQNQQIAKTLEARQQNLVDIPLTRKIQELEGKKLTAGGHQALDRFNFEMGNNQRAIEEAAPAAGSAATGARELTNQFRRAQGVAGINLQDQATKDAEMGSYLNLAQQTPGWANIAANANVQTGGAFERQAATQRGLAQQDFANESSSYAAAAKGLSTLADMYATGNT
jgi:hypothetical protein